MIQHRPIALWACTALVAASVDAQQSCSTALAVEPGFHAVPAITGAEVPGTECITGGANTATAAYWFSVTMAYDTVLTVSSGLPQNAGVNTRLHVYTGDCEALNCVGGNDDFAGAQSQLTFDVEAGVTYFVVFDDRWSPQGFDVWITEAPPIQLVGDPPSFTTFPIPVTGSAMAVVDMDNDDRDDVVGVSSSNVSIAHQQANGGFEIVNIPTTTAQFPATWSMCVGDLDGNGRNDLLYGNGQGVSFMISNAEGTGFTQVSGPEYVFSQRSNMVDINNDGHLDAFVCHDVAPNVYYLNDGSGNLMFNQGGIGPNGGNYGSLWTDFDNDGDQDCFIAKCGSSPPDVFMRNNGDGSFTDIAPAQGMADGHQSWSSAWGDYDNDGDMDVLIGSSSSGYHKLLRNDDGVFFNVTPNSGVDLFNGQSIEWVTHDFNNDGNLDIMGGYGMLLGHGDLTFSTAEESAPGTFPTNGPIGDLNNDGFLDVLNGGTAFLNDGNSNNWIKVSTTGVASNTNGIGARITITTPAGQQIREVRSGDGFEFMSSLIVHFGLGAHTEVSQVMVQWPSGTVDIIEDPIVNATLHVVEGLHSSVPATSAEPTLALYPNPVSDRMTVVGLGSTASMAVTAVDMAGARVALMRTSDGRIGVAGLAPGVYVLELRDGAEVHRIKFTKE